jgi:hypothetical protein
MSELEQDKITEDEDVGKVTMLEIHLQTGGIGIGSVGTVSPATYTSALIKGAEVLIKAAAEEAGGADLLPGGHLREWARVLRGETPHGRERS